MTPLADSGWPRGAHAHGIPSRSRIADSKGALGALLPGAYSLQPTACAARPAI
jgi:hypothetical protein